MHHRTTPLNEESPNRNATAGSIVLALVATIFSFAAPTANGGVDPLPNAGKSTGPTSLTYNRDIAPIVYKQCSGCHRPGQAAPFQLITYADAKKHASEIAKVTASGYMPPWLPEPGYGKFKNERHLSPEELGAIQRWIAAGAIEGKPGDLPTKPTWNDDWQLGKPDLVVEVPAYTLPAEGKDIYRNLVAAIPITERQFVKAVEFQTDNRKVVHHAFIEIDQTRHSRQRAEKEQPPGFDGMEGPESMVMPGGQLLGWQPGKVPSENPDGLAWILNPKTDLILQLHMNPSGKPEAVKARAGFHFSSTPPTNSTFRLHLTALELDIPSGVSNYLAEQSYTLPVDASAVRVGAHAHYLARDIHGFATLPDGRREELIWIKNWDFKWQGDYGYVAPVALPKGSKVTMQITYDNTTNNVRNPNHPPKRVQFGMQSTDEMGELYFQILPGNAQDYMVLVQDYSRYFFGVTMNFYGNRIRLNPNDSEAHKRFGRGLGYQGKTQEGIAELLEALRLNPKDGEIHYDLGSIYIRLGNTAEAYREFRAVAEADPGDGEAQGSLGITAAQMGKLEESKKSFEAAVRINPEDALAKSYLEKVNAAILQRDGK